MIGRLIDKILNLRIFRSFRVRTTPRWIILLLDMVIVAASYACTVMADNYSQFYLTSSIRVLTVGVLVLLVYFIVTSVSKTYMYVIRLSVIEDLYRVFMAVVSATVILIAINAIYQGVNGTSFVKYWNILVIGALSFSLMMIERLCIKYLYMRMNSAIEGRKRVLVLGTSFNSLFLANALKGELGGKYLPVGLLSIKAGPETAEINGFKHRLKKWKATAEEQRDEQAAQEISEAHHERLSAFAFSKCNIPVGAEIEFSCRGNQNSGTVCTVADDKHVQYNGEIWSLTGLAKHLLGTHGSIPGPKYFKYQGEWLTDIRRRLEGRD